MDALFLLAALTLQGSSITTPQREIRDPVPLGKRVWVVDSSGGGDFLAIQPAVDVARPGDLVAVRAAAQPYGVFTIDGKELSVLGISGTPRIVDFGISPVRIRNVRAGEFVALRDLVADVQATDVGGILWLEDLALPQSDVPKILSLEDVFECVVVRSRLEPGGLFFCAYGGNPAISLTRTSLHLFESRAAGSLGAVCGCGSPFINGGDGVLARDSFFLAFDSELIGGFEGGFRQPPFFNCVPGSPGLSYRGTNSTAFELDSSFPDGTVGAISTFQGLPRSLQAPAVVEEGALVPLTITGPPGDTVVTLLAPRPEVTFAPLLYGTVLVGSQPSVTLQGTLPASGVLNVDLALPPLPAGDEFQTWVVQSLQIDPQNSYLSSGSLVHVVRAGIL